MPQPELQASSIIGEEQGMTAKVTVEDVERVAELAHLELKPEEAPDMLNDLNAILDYVAELNELDTEGRDAAGAGERTCGCGGQRECCAPTCVALAGTRCRDAARRRRRTERFSRCRR